MEVIIFWYILVVAGIFLSACSQLLLKTSADKEHINFINSIVNWRVVSAYVIFFGALFTNITAMSKGVELKDIPVLESLGYVFVPILSAFVLKEKINKRTLVSISLIISGVIVFYI